MDFHLTKEQLLVRKMYRDFAENEVKPLAAEIDEETGIDKAGADNVLCSPNKATCATSNGWNSTLVNFEKYTGELELLPDCEWELRIPLAE